MIHSHIQNISQHDRQIHAERLGLSLADFDELLQSANYAYEVLKDQGPFYGNVEIKEPTFRTTATPVILPEGSKTLLTHLGNDILHLAKALKQLPDEQKKKLGTGIDFRIPPTWRVDIIFDADGNFKVNEIEGQDGASALMIAEQLAYNLQTLEETTAAKLIQTIKDIKPSKNDSYKIAWLRVNNPHNANAIQFVKMVDSISKGSMHFDHMYDEDLVSEKVKPHWEEYAAVISETSLSPQQLYALGIKEEQVLLAGNYNAIVNKGIFALIYDKTMEDFWLEHLGKERLTRLQKAFIPTRFITEQNEIETARKEGKIVKASWAGKDTFIINRSRGVALPTDDDVHGTEEQWDLVKELFTKGVTFITQDFIVPGKLTAYLRKRGTTLEPVEWYNRICVKYVADANPNAEATPNVTLTATEVTLGPSIVPAGRKCAFTAGKLS